jgi:hypothetical protein
MFCAAMHAGGVDPVDPSTLDSKVLIGYQGWFTCPEDGLSLLDTLLDRPEGSGRVPS